MSKYEANKEQVGGDHYKGKPIQPVEYGISNDLGFVEGNVVKYVTRWKDKGGLDDLRKARHYLDLYIQYLERNIESRGGNSVSLLPTGKQDGVGGNVELRSDDSGAQNPTLRYEDFCDKLKEWQDSTRSDKRQGAVRPRTSDRLNDRSGSSNWPDWHN